jgi:hypothetical protein
MKILTDDMLCDYRKRLIASLSTDQYSSRVHCAVRLWFCIHQRVPSSRQDPVGHMYLFVAVHTIGPSSFNSVWDLRLTTWNLDRISPSFCFTCQYHSTSSSNLY